MNSSLKPLQHAASTLLLVSPLLLPSLAQAQTADPDPAAPSATSEPATAEATTPPETPTAGAPDPVSAPPEPAPAAPATTESSTPPPPKMDLSAPPPPPARLRKARVHNGFYLRGGFGAGGLWPKLTDYSDAERFDMEGGSVALGFDAMVGGSPADGFALGGALTWLGGTSEIDGNGAQATVSLLMAGPFFDAFPDPKDGFHLGAMAGFAMHGISDHPSKVDRALGFGGAAWLGYDWWVSDEISAGLMLRFSGALTNGDEGAGSLKANSMGLTAMATALYH